MERNLKDKNIVIAGVYKGIGLGIAEKFLDNGAKVVILLDNDDKEGNVAVNVLNTKFGAGSAVFIRCDVSKDLEKVSSEIISGYKTVDVLINNAGWPRDDSIRDTLEVNLIAVVEWSTKFIEHMRRDVGGNGGTIINLSYIFGPHNCKNRLFYAAAMHGVLGFTKNEGCVDTFKKTGVRMIALCQSFTRTDLFDFVNNMFDDINFSIISEFIKSYAWKEASAVGEAAVKVFKLADSGSIWLVEGGNPVEEPTLYHPLLRSTRGRLLSE